MQAFIVICIVVLLLLNYVLRKYNQYLPLINHSFSNNQSALKYMNEQLNKAIVRRVATIIFYDIIRLSPGVNTFLIERFIQFELRGRYEQGAVKFVYVVFKVVRRIANIAIVVAVILLLFKLIQLLWR